MSINLSEIIKKNLEERDVYDAEEHIHKERRVGASQTRMCIYMGALRRGNVEIPRPSGKKAEKGPMWVGKIHHTGIEDLVVNHYKKHPLKGIQCAEEVFIEMQFGPEIIETPIDLAFVSDPGFIQKEIEFANEKRIFNVKHPDATWERIFDIKTASTFAFYKYLKKHNEENRTSLKYEAQMHVMMKATGLKECTILFVNKEDFSTFEHVVVFNDMFWEEIVERQKRMLELSDAIIKEKDADVFSKDLAFFDEDEEGYECTYCPMSECHEETDKNGRVSLIIDKPCNLASELVLEKAKDKFKVSTWWKRGPSHIVITDIKGEEIESKNKKGQFFKDTLFYAYRNYERLE